MANKQAPKLLEFWDSVATTDMNHTKQVSFGSRKFTTIAAQYQLRKVTEKFGMIGTGFGIEQEDFKTVTFGNGEVLLSYHAQFWYVQGEKKAFIPMHASIMLGKFNKNGGFTIDDDAYKKVATDGFTKVISKLGFNADIFLGEADNDNKYAAPINNPLNAQPHQLMTAQQAFSPAPAPPFDVNAFVADVLSKMAASKSAEELEAARTAVTSCPVAIPPLLQVSIREAYTKANEKYGA